MTARTHAPPELPEGAPDDAILVDMPTAEIWTGRPAGTLRRWVSEGRITRYGTQRDMWLNLRELPEAGSGQGAPPKRHADSA